MHRITLDVVIFGGGIAGLWSLIRLQQQGYRALLFETQALGGRQSIAAQGIIHGGTKYSLTERSRPTALQQQPTYWRACLAGTGAIDLQNVRLLAQHQYLWTTSSLLANLSGRIASHLTHSQMRALTVTAYPACYQNPTFRGTLYQLDEPVLDTQSLIHTLAQQTQGHSYHLPNTPAIQRHNAQWYIHLADGQKLYSHAILLTAGAGNAAILHQLGRTTPRMQRRPLHMVMLRGPLPSLHAHYLTGGMTPTLTITSHPQTNGEQVWYLGGTLAEEGISRTSAAQIAAGHAALTKALPWIDLTHTSWASWRIDRAEPQTECSQRPQDSIYTKPTTC